MHASALRPGVHLGTARADSKSVVACCETCSRESASSFCMPSSHTLDFQARPKAQTARAFSCTPAHILTRSPPRVLPLQLCVRSEGRSRSVALVVAYMVIRLRKPLANALQFVRCVRWPESPAPHAGT